GDEANAGAARSDPPHLRLDVAHARNGDLQPLADVDSVAAFDAAALVGEIGEANRRLAAVAVMQGCVDRYGVTFLAVVPLADTLHRHASHSGAVHERLQLGDSECRTRSV